MLEVHGTENDTELVTSSSGKYPFGKFAHAIRTKDIYSFYDKNIIKVKNKKTDAIRRVLGEKSHSTKTRVAHQIFIKGMELICNGVVDRKFIFKLPFKNLDVTFRIQKTSQKTAKNLLNYYKGIVDPFDMGFEMAEAVLRIKYPKRPDVDVRVALDKRSYATMMNNVKNKKTYQNSKIYNLENITEMLEPLYPTLTKMSIRSVMRHGLNIIFKALIRRVDSYINLDNSDESFFMYFCGAKKSSHFRKVRRKIRYLRANERGKPTHDSMYYFYLSPRAKTDFDSGLPIRVDCTRYIDELEVAKQYAPHIYQLYVPECVKQGFFTEVDLNTEGLVYYKQYVDKEFKRI